MTPLSAAIASARALNSLPRAGRSGQWWIVIPQLPQPIVATLSSAMVRRVPIIWAGLVEPA